MLLIQIDITFQTIIIIADTFLFSSKSICFTQIFLPIFLRNVRKTFFLLVTEDACKLYNLFLF
jgi:hypothetical protein